MSRLAPVALALPLLALQGCDVDFNHSAERTVDDFHAIAVGDGIDVRLHLGTDHAVKVQTEGDPDSVEARVEDGKLILTKAHGWTGFITWFDWWSHYTADVTLPRLDYLSVRGGGEVRTLDEFSGDSIDIIGSGGSSLDFKGRYRSMSYRGSGGSSTRLAGTAQEFEARTSGGAQVRAKELEVDTADLVSSGGSSITLTVNNKLKARATGGSNIRYSGKPAETDIQARGGGDVHAR